MMFKTITDINKIRSMKIKPSETFEIDEYETVINIDNRCTTICTNISSHIRKLMRKNYLQFIHAEVFDNFIVSITYKVPNNYIGISISKNRRENEHFSMMMR